VWAMTRSPTWTCYAKQGAGRGYSGVNGLNVLLATVSTPGSVPLIVDARLRRGGTNSVRGAAKLLVDSLATAKRAGARGLLVVRADSAFYAHPVIAAARRAEARFSVTLRHTPSVLTAIATIPADGWTTIQYPHAVWGPAAERWVSDAEVAEINYTAFTGRRRGEHVTARLIVRRVRRLNPDTAPLGHTAQGELFAAYRSTRCSPTARWRCWRPRPRTATTPSSSRSSPTSSPPRWPTCPRPSSARTAPGWPVR
jgi:hypothetical protein